MNDPENNRRAANLWDPTSAWPTGRKLIWSALAICVLIGQGPSFCRNIPGRWDGSNDFFQDWTSARNVVQGRPAYLPLAEAVVLHGPKIGGRQSVRPLLPWNAHPPTSVLATLPFALLDYPDAMTLWNVLGLAAIAASVALICRELSFPLSVWSIPPIATLVLLCNPVRLQIVYGQWNAALLLLLTLAWCADRSGRNALAGFWVALAASLKIFPVFFLVYFAVRRRWRSVAACAFWLVAISLLTALVAGPGAYRDYVNRVLPTLTEFDAYGNNASLRAFWLKNFSSGAHVFGLTIEPLVHAPWMAQAGTVVSYALLLAATLFLLNRSTAQADRSQRCGDLAFALTIVTALLLTPVCWDHYLLLLALPLALLWARVGNSTLARLALLILVVCVWAGALEIWRAAGLDLKATWPDYMTVPRDTYRIHRPSFPPLFLSLHFYALLACYFWLARLIWRETSPGGSEAREESQQCLSGGDYGALRAS
jgi:hypothetical protein